MRKQTSLFLLAAILLFFQVVPLPASAFTQEAQAASAVSKEYEVKAAFLYNFAKFIEWPPDPPGEFFIIGILGDDPFGPVIDQLLLNKTIKDKKVLVRRFRGVNELEFCHILFVSASAANQAQSAFDRFKGSAVLTVGEASGFARSGGVVNFYIQENKVRFEINQKAAGEAGLKISSQLLKLAKITS